MKDLIRQRLNEEMTKSDVKIVKDRIKNDKALEDKVVEITSNVLTQLYKSLWVKRAFWKNTLSNKAN